MTPSAAHSEGRCQVKDERSGDVALTKQDIVAGLRALGVKPGQVIMAHSALSSFGVIEGGADTVIDALIEAVGPEGTLLMPAMAHDKVFDVTASKSNVGLVTERFWRRESVTRSIHPTHSAAGIGPRVAELFAGHVSQPTALGPESPWGRMTRMNDAFILLLGCDQDRNTLLHSAEEAVDAPYLTPLEASYLDENREQRTITLEQFPGPHRDFIGLDRAFRARGVMQVGHIGRAVCRMMHAPGAFAVAVEELQRDPAAVLCDNPHCDDCVMQRGRIRRARLAQEAFTLAARLDDVAANLWQVPSAAAFLNRLGIRDIEIGEEIAGMLVGMLAATPDAVANLRGELKTAELRVHVVAPPPMLWQTLEAGPTEAFRAATLMARELGADTLKLTCWPPPPEVNLAAVAKALESHAAVAVEANLKLLIENDPHAAWSNKERCEAILGGCASGNVRLGFNPAEFARVGEHPFLKTSYKGALKKHLAVLYLADGCPPPEAPHALPGRGKGEVKELVSLLRCRSFDGILCLRPGERGPYPWATLQEHWEAFWRLMDGM